jgi:hypothetical protein
MGRYGLDSYDSGKGYLAGFCEKGNGDSDVRKLLSEQLAASQEGISSVALVY